MSRDVSISEVLMRFFRRLLKRPLILFGQLASRKWLVHGRRLRASCSKKTTRKEEPDAVKGTLVRNKRGENFIPKLTHQKHYRTRTKPL